MSNEHLSQALLDKIVEFDDQTAAVRLNGRFRPVDQAFLARKLAEVAVDLYQPVIDALEAVIAATADRRLPEGHVIIDGIEYTLSHAWTDLHYNHDSDARHTKTVTEGSGYGRRDMLFLADGHSYAVNPDTKNVERPLKPLYILVPV